MAAMLRAERAHASELVDAGRAAAGMAGRVQEAVLALMRAADSAECVSVELPGLLGIDAAALCAEDQQPGGRPVGSQAEGNHQPGSHTPGSHALPPGTVRRLLDGRDVVFRAAASDALMLHAEAARLALHDALVRVPGAGAPMLLALASRDARALDPAQGSHALGFLGRAVAAALGR
jgi:uncharacterized protein YigA (DUF484 family)